MTTSAGLMGSCFAAAEEVFPRRGRLWQSTEARQLSDHAIHLTLSSKASRDANLQQILRMVAVITSSVCGFL